MDINTLILGFILSGNIDIFKIVAVIVFNLINNNFYKLTNYIKTYNYPISYAVSSINSDIEYPMISIFIKEKFADYINDMSTQYSYGRYTDDLRKSYSFSIDEPIIVPYNGNKIKIIQTEYKTKDKTDYIIKMCFKNKKNLESFLNDAKEHYKLVTENIKMYYISNKSDGYYNHWRGSEFLINKNFSNTFIEKELLNDIKSNIDNYFKRIKNPKFSGVPRKIGFIFYGKPGLGKTSLAIAIANEYNRKIYILDKDSTTGKYLKNNISYIEPGNILLINEADLVFDINNYDSDKKNGIETIYNESKVTMKTELYEIFDGYNYLDDTIVILTTNNLSDIDPTLMRSGRIDYKYEIKYPTLETIKDIYEYYTDKSIDVDNINKELCEKNVSEIINMIAVQSVDKIDNLFYKK